MFGSAERAKGNVKSVLAFGTTNRTTKKKKINVFQQMLTSNKIHHCPLLYEEYGQQRCCILPSVFS